MYTNMTLNQFWRLGLLSLLLAACTIPPPKSTQQTVEKTQVKRTADKPGAQPDQPSALELHLQEPGVRAFFAGTVWKKPAVDYYLQFTSPLMAVLYRGNSKLYDIPFKVTAVTTDPDTGYLCWKVLWIEQETEEHFEMYFPQADALTLGRQFHLNPQKDAGGRIREGTGIVYSRVASLP